MTDESHQNPSLGEAAGQFLAGLSPTEKNTSQPEIYKFIRWYGWERSLAGLTAPEVANYAERLSLSDTDYGEKLELIRAFLAYASKTGLSKTNLTTHLKAKKTRAGHPPTARQNLPEAIPLTRKGYAELETELSALKNKRPWLIEEIRRAAADKDFRENAPLDAARDEQAHLEARIREIEDQLRRAVIIDEETKGGRANVGSHVTVRSLESNGEQNFQLVSPSEVDPSSGKISIESPFGSAVMDHAVGDEVTVDAPSGKVRFEVIEVVG